MAAIHTLQLDGFLSFPPGSSAFELQPLNVLIGPNGAGKSNLIEAFELLAAAPVDFAAAVRAGGGAEEWPWKGPAGGNSARIETVLADGTPTGRPLRHGIEFGPVARRTEVLDEVVEETDPCRGKREVHFYYRFQQGHPAIGVRQENGDVVQRSLKRESVPPDQSVLSRYTSVDFYPEVAWISDRFKAIRTFREWTFGRYASIRQPQRADLPDDSLLPNNLNLALVLNYIGHSGATQLEHEMGRFLPRFARLSTRVAGGSVQFYVHEKGLASPIPATRLSDGTLRFMAILATLFHPSPPPLVCIEEPELGLHPDAVVALGDLLLEASSRMQLVVTTHSDALVAALSNRADSVVTCKWKGGGSVLERVDPERLRRWLDEYTLGDIWRMGKLGANP